MIPNLLQAEQNDLLGGESDIPANISLSYCERRLDSGTHTHLAIW